MLFSMCTNIISHLLGALFQFGAQGNRLVCRSHWSAPASNSYHHPTTVFSKINIISMSPRHLLQQNGLTIVFIWISARMVCGGWTKMVSAFTQLFLTTLLSRYSQIASPILKLHSWTDVFACDVQEKEPCVLFFFFSSHVQFVRKLRALHQLRLKRCAALTVHVYGVCWQRTDGPQSAR